MTRRPLEAQLLTAAAALTTLGAALIWLGRHLDAGVQVIPDTPEGQNP